MVDETLNRAGLHIDDLNKLRVLEPEISQENQDLKEECHEFNQKVNDFQGIVENITDMMNRVAKEVEKEKMKAIGARNLLKSVSKQREAKQQQLKALIVEKKMEHERLRKQYESLQKIEAEQLEFIEQFLLQK